MQINNHWNMLGHQWAVELLKLSLSNGHIRHAYLFTGPQGIGRRTLALRFAQAINCTQFEVPGEPCGECRSCQLFENMLHPDLSIVQSDMVGGNLKVDQVRELQHILSLTPYEAQFRIALILRFEEANQNAANALLKTLEEPPSQVIMLLTAQEPETLLPTIISRCELIRLRPLSIAEIAKGLQEQYGISTENAKLLSHISGGRPGYALRLHQNPEIMGRRKNWLGDHQRLLAANRVERFSYADEISKDKEEVESTLQIWSSFWRDVLLVTSGSSAPIINLDYKENINNLAVKLDLNTLKKIVEAFERTRQLIRQNVNTRLALEVLFLDLPFT